MALLREDREAFVAALERSEDRLGYAASIVLKDYWLCAVLRALHAHFAGTFLLKGGTSLSKGWGLIERMSEDIDILVMARTNETHAERRQRLLNMTETVSSSLGLSTREYRPPGHGSNAHRDDLFEYDTMSFGAGGIDSAGVLLQSGYGDGWEPQELIRVAPYLNAGSPGDYSDLSPIQLPALKPVRTLIEKLHALHSAVTDLDPSAPAALHAQSRMGRHYYDIYCCLEHASTIKDLQDRKRMEILFADVVRISRERFGSNALRPSDGYAASEAFRPEANSDLRAQLEKSYEEAKTLMRIDAATRKRWPSFGQVLKRIEEKAELL